MTLDEYSEVVERLLAAAKIESRAAEKIILAKFYSNNESQVICALLARQYRLLWTVLNSPAAQNHDAAPMFLRSMADAYINIAYILKSPHDHATLFIRYGLGDEYLQYEQRKEAARAIDDAERRKEHEVFADQLLGWIESQIATWAIDVNLGSWSGKNTREMAIEAGEEDFYRFVYKPFSACIHSTWGHVGKYNVLPCNEPLHKFHLVGNYSDPIFDSDYVLLSIKYFQKTLDKINLSLAFNTYCFPERDLIFWFYKLCDDVAQ